MPLFQHNSISSASCLQNAAPPPLMNWPRSQPQLTPGQGGASFSGQRGATPNPHPHPHHTPEAMQTSWYVFFYIFPPTSPKKTKTIVLVSIEFLSHSHSHSLCQPLVEVVGASPISKLMLHQTSLDRATGDS